MNDPSPEELAAIVAAVEATWPRPADPDPPTTVQAASSAWKFSARWWFRPTTLRRERPWIGRTS